MDDSSMESPKETAQGFLSRIGCALMVIGIIAAILPFFGFVNKYLAQVSAANYLCLTGVIFLIGLFIRWGSRF